MNIKKMLLMIKTLSRYNILDEYALRMMTYFVDHDEGTFRDVMKFVGHKESASHTSTQRYRIRLTKLRTSEKGSIAYPALGLLQATKKVKTPVGTGFKTGGRGSTVYILSLKGKKFLKDLEKCL